MKDPFLPLAIPELTQAVQPLADWLQLPTLSLHIHEVLGAALLYTVIFWPISPLISGWLAPKAYYGIPKRKRVNWDAHVVSMVQCLFINGLAVWVALFDESRRTMGWEERVWAYTETSAMVQALAAGYFLWDLIVTSMYLDVFGIGTLAHAVGALIVYTLGFVSPLDSLSNRSRKLIYGSVQSSTIIRRFSFFGSCLPLSSTSTGSWINWA
jgi:hypothetical protein